MWYYRHSKSQALCIRLTEKSHSYQFSELGVSGYDHTPGIKESPISLSIPNPTNARIGLRQKRAWWIHNTGWYWACLMPMHVHVCLACIMPIHVHVSTILAWSVRHDNYFTMSNKLFFKLRFDLVSWGPWENPIALRILAQNVNSPNVGFEPTTLGSRVPCYTDWANWTWWSYTKTYMAGFHCRSILMQLSNRMNQKIDPHSTEFQKSDPFSETVLYIWWELLLFLNFQSFFDDRLMHR